MHYILGVNKLSVERRTAVVSALVEGSSVRAVVRMTGASKGAILCLLMEVGEFCSVYQHHALRDLCAKRVEADEIWAYCGAKRRNATQPGQGDIWTYTALDADSKLMISWLVGPRSHANTRAFMVDVASRLGNRVQLTTDGLSWYLAAVEHAFGWNGVDFAQIIKTYGMAPDELERQRRYSPAVCTGAIKTRVMGEPDMEKVSTSYVERSNLSMRMGMRRFTRLTNAFSNKAENHAHAVSLHFMHYNFCRPHTTLTKGGRRYQDDPGDGGGAH